MTLFRTSEWVSVPTDEWERIEAVLKAAEAQEARHEEAGWSRGLFTENNCPCDVCSAVRARREDKP